MSTQNWYLKIGRIASLALLVLVVMGFFWTPYDPSAMNSLDKLQGLSLTHLMGTDHFGRDIFSRVLQGAGTTVTIGLLTVVMGAVVGTLIGAITGYLGGWVDSLCMHVLDVITAFPSVLLALVLISVVGSGTTNVILVLGIVFTPSFARVTRSTFATLRTQNFIQSARLMGVPTWRIVTVHLLPNIWSVLTPCLTIGFNNAVLAEASMSYLGVGVSPTDPSLGYMLSEAQGMLVTAPWYALSVGMTIVVMIFAVGLWGEGLQKEAER
ncbi:ABC transporter permease [Bengtsoniella intestinalis]|uniref:ABC transporter permease n=1 Tax=Bengtsoniella intestinalis TaxID=3073143 RepID=UPI00391FBF72